MNQLTHKAVQPMRNSVHPSIYASTQLGVQYSVLRLYSWPQLSELPSEMIPDVAKVCALLAVRPTGAPLISRLLGISRESVTHIVDMLHLHGHLQNAVMPGKSGLRTEGALEFETPELPTQPVTRSIIGRLWQRLSKQKA